MWSWFVGTQGVCVWTMGGLSVPSEWSTVPSISSDTVNKDRDPLFDAVDAILVQGNGHPPLGHAIWQIPSLQAVVWTSPNSRGGQRNAPLGWRSFTRLFFHEECQTDSSR
jgi:hypothetical protein